MKLLAENKLVKYLLYAIGEVLIVIVGILFALQVNNWNETRILKKNEIEILRQLNVDLKSNLRELKEIFTSLERRIIIGNKVLQHLNSSNEVTDSLKIWAELAHGMNIFNNANTTYNNIENSGTNIISDDTLRLRITLMYELDFVNIHEREQRFLNLHFQNYYKEFLKSFKASPSKDGKLVINTPRDIIALKNNDDYKNGLIAMLNHRELRLYFLKITLERLEQLIKDIESEIENQ